MKNDRNLTSETCPWNNHPGLGQRIIQRHAKVVRQPLSSFAGVPRRLGHDRISLISDIHRRHNSDNFSTLRRSSLPLVNFFYLTKLQSQNQSRVSSYKNSSSHNGMVQRVHFDRQPKVEAFTGLKNRDVAVEHHKEANTKQTSHDLSQIIAPKPHFISGSTINRLVDTDSEIPATSVQNDVQATLNEQHISVQAGDGRINKTDAVPSVIETAEQQHDSNVPYNHDNSVKHGEMSLRNEIPFPRLASLDRAIYRKITQLSGNNYQRLGLGQQTHSSQHTTVFRKPVTSKQHKVQTPFINQQNSVQDSHDNSINLMVQSLQTEIAPSRLTSLDRAINRKSTRLSDSSYQRHDLAKQIHSRKHTPIFRKRLDAQMPESFATNAFLWQQTIATNKINQQVDSGIPYLNRKNGIHTPFNNQQYESTTFNLQGYLDNPVGPADQFLQTDIMPHRLPSLDRAINRKFTQISGNPYQMHDIGKQNNSRQNTRIYRKRLDAQMPESSAFNVSLWQQPMDAKINEDNVSLFSQHSPVNVGDEGINKKDAMPSVNETAGQQYQSNIHRNYDASKPGDQLPHSATISSRLTSLDRAINRKGGHLSDNTIHNLDFGQQIHSRQNAIVFRKRLGAAQMPESSVSNVSPRQQSLAATIINRAVDTDSRILATSIQKEGQPSINTQQASVQGYLDISTKPDSQPPRTESGSSRLTSLDRAIKRKGSDIPDNTNQNLDLGKHIYTRQNAIIFRKRLDAVQMPESSVSNVLPWQQSLAATIINRAVDTDSGRLATSVQNEDQPSINTQQASVQGYLGISAKPDIQSPRTESGSSRLTSLDRAINRKGSHLSDNSNQNLDLGQQIHSRQNAIIFRKRLDAVQMPESSVSNVSPWQESLAATTINQEVDTDLGNLPKSEQSAVKASIFTPRFGHQSEKETRKILRKDFSNQVLAGSAPLFVKADSIVAQRNIPGMIQKKSSAGFDSGPNEMVSKNYSMQLPLAENFNIQRNMGQSVVQKEENTNMLYRQETADFSSDNLLVGGAAVSETEEAKASESEATQPSADELVDKVWRKLMRKLVVEQERIGGSAKWL